MIKTNKKEIVDKLLNDKGFQKIVEADIGENVKVEVDWDNDMIRFFGSRGSKQIGLNETIEVLIKDKKVSLQ
jgi:hypothetical protein